MKPELEKALLTKYPKIFQDYTKPMTQTCMCWGLECGDGWYNLLDTLCSLIQWRIDQSIEAVAACEKHNQMVLQTRAGDMTLFDEHYISFRNADPKASYLEGILSPDVEPLPDYGYGLRKVNETIPQVIADQVKEKFATLRFYFHGGDEYIEGAVALAEQLSGTLCEVCGKPGKACGTGWLRTACDEHEKRDPT